MIVASRPDAPADWRSTATWFLVGSMLVFLPASGLFAGFSRDIEDWYVRAWLLLWSAAIALTAALVTAWLTSDRVTSRPRALWLGLRFAFLFCLAFYWL